MLKEPIRYQVQLADPAGHRFAIRLTIPQPDPAGQILRLPAWIPGSYLIRDFSRQIETLQAHAGGTPIAAHKLDSHSWQCAPCTGPLMVDYRVYAWDLSVRGAHFDESHAFFNGCSLFLAAVGQEARACILTLCPPDHASDWRVHTSLPRVQDGEDRTSPNGFGAYQAPDYDALVDAPVEIGTPQCIGFEAYGARHELVFTGVAPRLDLQRIADDVKTLCETQIALFDPQGKQAAFVDSADHYTFLVQITGDGYGGLEHRASTALMTYRSDLPTLGNEPGPNYPRFLGLVSHEYFHSWNVKRIKPATFAPYDYGRPNHTRLLWVFEGFTSYYDDLMLLRAGLIDEPRYFKLLARNLDQVRRGPGRLKQSVAESSFDAWTRYYKQDENSPNALVSYYTKGALMALALDLEIRRQSADRRSLDDVMRLLWQRYGQAFFRGQARGVAEDAMPAIILDATGVDLGPFIARYVDGCEDLPLGPALAHAGITLSAQAADARPSLGVLTQPTAGGLRLKTVFEGGPAHQAGLAAGDWLLAIDQLHVAGADGLNQLLDAHRPGDTVPVHVFRRDELRQFTVCLGDPPALQHTLQRIEPGNEPQ